MTRAAIYARVSCADQKCLSQLTECREFIARHGWELVHEYRDAGISGSKKNRPQLDKCIADAKAGKFDAIVVFKLDRWGRSLVHLASSLDELQRIGVRFVATSQGIDTDRSNATSGLVMHILAAVAEWERETIRERTRAGLKAARKAGKQLGRPTRVFRIDQAREMREAGKTWHEISAELGVPFTTIRGALLRQDKAAKQA